MPEHKPMTEAELAVFEEILATDSVEDQLRIVLEKEPDTVRLLSYALAEVRRLRTESRQCYSVRCDDTLNPPEKLAQGYTTIEIGMCPFLAMRFEAPSLMLANGTVVRAGDMVVWEEGHKKVRVTAVGEYAFLGRPFVGRTVVWGGEILCHVGQNWRLWSEVYPDRPVPGVGE